MDKAQQLLQYKANARREPSFFIEDMQASRPEDAIELAVNIMRVAMSAAYEKHSDPKEIIAVMRTLIEYEIHRQAEFHMTEDGYV